MKNKASGTDTYKHASRLAIYSSCVAALLAVIEPACAVKAPDRDSLPPPLPKSMPPLPAGQGPEAEEPAPAKPPAHAVDAKSVELAAGLFKEQGLSIDRLRITRVIIDDLMKMPVPKPVTNIIVHVQQLYSNLPVHGRNGELVYVFRNGQLDNSCAGNEQQRKAIADLKIDCKPVITRWQALEGLRQYSHRDAKPKDQGNAQLVILNTESIGIRPARYILAWRANMAGGYPYAFIDAISGEMLMYDNGIRY